MQELVRIHRVGDHEAVQFAAEELSRYLRLLKPDLEVSVTREPTFHVDVGDLWLGLTGPVPPEHELSVETPELDDAISIQVQGYSGSITGANPRAVLLAVYRFLWELGFRWLRPGPDGESVPDTDVASCTVSVQEKPSYRHRGICIEGSLSREHLMEIIEWLPRVGLNSYFIQFRDAYTFFDHWYSHAGNPFRKAEAFSEDMAANIVHDAEREIRRRGLLYHAVGHGWTCEPFGIRGLGWDPVETQPRDDVAQYLAKVNGKRGLFQGIPLNTNLCYSNPQARKIMVDEIVRYVGQHPDIDYLHVWLADGFNNQCECAECRKMIPSDFYVLLLNELDKRLTAEHRATRIVFLLYVDLLWPPKTIRFKNPDRFVLMFAPITRTYSRSFAASGEKVPMPSYVRNHLELPSSVDETVGFLRAWQGIFDGDGFDFDYHYWRDHYLDPGYYASARILHDDIQALADLGLHGFMSCQVSRAFFPTGLGMAAMAQTLWNRDADFETIVRDHFSHTFGIAADEALAYLKELSSRFDPPRLRGDATSEGRRAFAYTEISAFVDAFLPTIEANVASAAGDRCRLASWKYLAVHAEMTKKFAAFLEAVEREQSDEVDQRLRELAGSVWSHEDETDSVFDPFEYLSVVRARFIQRSLFG